MADVVPIGGGHQHNVTEIVADFFAKISDDSVSAVAGQVGVDDDRAVLFVLQFFDRVPAIGREVRLQIERFARFLDRRSQEWVVFDDEELHTGNLGPHSEAGKLNLLASAPSTLGPARHCSSQACG